jgi:hypothetical protein
MISQIDPNNSTNSKVRLLAIVDETESLAVLLARPTVAVREREGVYHSKGSLLLPC